VYGVARELSIQSGKPLKPFVWKQFQAHEAAELKVAVEDAQQCLRYSACSVEAITVKPSTFKLRYQLAVCGIRPINNIVDITNLVLLELGQPMHAFDVRMLHGSKIVVRPAKAQESIHLLDDQTKQIPEGACLIADADGPVAVGGVMGGMKSAVSEHTTACLFESAYFAPSSIRKTSKTMQISSESSKRFERGCDPNNTLIALEYACHLLREVCPDSRMLGCTDIQQKAFSHKVIPCRRSRTVAILGYDVSFDEMELCFQRLQFSFVSDGIDSYSVSVPAYRHDLVEEIDLIEDIAKILGYESELSKDPVYAGSKRPHHPLFLGEQAARKTLVALGLQECITCNLISPQMVDVVLNHPIQPANLVHMLNPLSSEQSVLRPSLLPGLLKVVKHNINQRNLNLCCFEVGNIHLKRLDGTFEEQLVMGIIMTGNHPLDITTGVALPFDFYDLKGVIENFCKEFDIDDTECVPSEVSVFHTGRQAALRIGKAEEKGPGNICGMFGELHPALLRKLDMTQRIYFAEFDVQRLLQFGKQRQKMEPLVLFPSSLRDWTVMLPEVITWSEIKHAIEKTHSSLLENYSLSTIYRGEKVTKDHKNVTINFVYRRLDKTISQEEVDVEHARIIQMAETILSNTNSQV